MRSTCSAGRAIAMQAALSGVSMSCERSVRTRRIIRADDVSKKSVKKRDPNPVGKIAGRKLDSHALTMEIYDLTSRLSHFSF